MDYNTLINKGQSPDLALTYDSDRLCLLLDFCTDWKEQLMLKKILLLALLPAIAFAEELPAPVKAIEKQGITIIKTFDAPGGMKGYLGK